MIFHGISQQPISTDSPSVLSIAILSYRQPTHSINRRQPSSFNYSQSFPSIALLLYRQSTQFICIGQPTSSIDNLPVLSIVYFFDNCSVLSIANLFYQKPFCLIDSRSAILIYCYSLLAILFYHSQNDVFLHMTFLRMTKMS